MPRWTAADIPDLSGRVAVVTGANSGLGYETAAALASRGASVVLACRDPSKGRSALDAIHSSYPGAELELGELDLADLSSVRAFAGWFAAHHGALDILVNNAGVMAIPRRETADGFEMQFGTNHLGHFALTGLVLEKLLEAPGARVVNMSSEMARIGRIGFDDLQSSRSYRKWLVYGKSKLANQLFTLELDQRASAKGLTSVAAHPGYSATNLQAVGPQMSGSALMKKITDLENAVFAQPATMGALPALYAATSPGVASGSYYGPDGAFSLRGYPRKVAFVRAANDREVAKRLWEESERLTGVTYRGLA